MRTLPAVSVDQMREVDRLAIEEFGVTLLQMMENAGANLARLAEELWGPAAGRRVVVMAGKGNNGGGGLSGGRHLLNRGADVSVVAVSRDPGEAASHQMRTLERAGVDVLDAGEAEDALERADLVIDSLIGYSLRDAPREPIASLIRSANKCGRPVLSLDVPSGVNPDTGEVFEPAIAAEATMTLALPKVGLLKAKAQTGDLYVADLGLPPALFQGMGIELDAPFGGGTPVLLKGAGG